jgi:hypothetical protein
LLRGRWGTNEGIVELRQATTAEGWRAEQEWVGRLGNWPWLAAILDSYPRDRFAIVSATGELLALLASKKKRLLNHPGGPLYRLDFVEVAPRLIGSGFGRVAFAIAGASRALELGATGGLVLGAVPGARRAYERNDGHPVRRACDAYNWNARASLVPFHFSHRVLMDLGGAANASRTA